LFLTPEEEALVSTRAGRTLGPSQVIGIGLEPEAERRPSRDVLDGLGVPQEFVLYLGRVDRNKGCATLLEYFEEYIDAGGNTTLVLAGPSTLMIPNHPRIRALGYVRMTFAARSSHTRARSSFRRRTRASASCSWKHGTMPRPRS
jgi:hypothetical protein